jgi:hypothetical protein
VADRGAGAARVVMTRVQAVPAGFAARAPKGRRIDRGFEKGLNELSGKVLKTHVIYLVVY